MKKLQQSPKKLVLKRVSIVQLTPEQSVRFLGGVDDNKPKKTETCRACGSAMQDCSGQ